MEPNAPLSDNQIIADMRERSRKARRWIMRAGSFQRSVWLLKDVRLFEAQPKQGSPNRYQLAIGTTLGREFEVCPEMSDDQVQALVNAEADEVRMTVELEAEGNG